MEKAIADMLGVMVDHLVNALSTQIGSAKDDVLKQLSGKTIKVQITLPDFTKEEPNA